MTTTEPRLMTADELRDLPDDGMRHELVDGELRTTALAGWDHWKVGNYMGNHLGRHVEAHELGDVLVGDLGCLLATDPDLVRAPDVAFVRRERVEEAGSVPGFWPGAPDLVVEVISPNDRYSEVAENVGEWLQYGARMVVVADPCRWVVNVHRPGQPPRELREGDVLDGEDVVPGWRLPISDLFSVIPRS